MTRNPAIPYALLMMHYLCPHCFSFLGSSRLLRFFDEFEAVYSQFNQAQLSTSLDNEQFLSLLKKLDDCKSYVATNPQVSRWMAGGQRGGGLGGVGGTAAAGTAGNPHRAVQLLGVPVMSTTVLTAVCCTLASLSD